MAPQVKVTITTRRRRSLYRVLYVYLKGNQMPQSMREEIHLGAHDVVMLDRLGWHGLAPHFPDRRHLWAIHYGGEGPSPEAGLCGGEIPSWCAALHSAFSAILNAAYQGSRTVFKDVQVAMDRPSPRPYPINVRDHVLELVRPGGSCTALSRARLLLVRPRSKSGVMCRGDPRLRALDDSWTLTWVDPGLSDGWEQGPGGRSDRGVVVHGR